MLICSHVVVNRNNLLSVFVFRICEWIKEWRSVSVSADTESKDSSRSSDDAVSHPQEHTGRMVDWTGALGGGGFLQRGKTELLCLVSLRNTPAVRQWEAPTPTSHKCVWWNSNGSFGRRVVHTLCFVTVTTASCTAPWRDDGLTLVQRKWTSELQHLLDRC